jgi:hypothetical protein
MTNDKGHKTHHPSELEKTHIAFEYDVSWKEARDSIKQRTHKK